MAMTGLLVGWRIHTSIGRGARRLPAAAGVRLRDLLVMAHGRAAGPHAGGGQQRQLHRDLPDHLHREHVRAAGELPAGAADFAEWNPVSTVDPGRPRAVRQHPGRVPEPDAWSLQHPVVYTLLWACPILAVFVPLSVRATCAPRAAERRPPPPPLGTPRGDRGSGPARVRMSCDEHPQPASPRPLSASNPLARGVAAAVPAAAVRRDRSRAPSARHCSRAWPNSGPRSPRSSPTRPSRRSTTPWSPWNGPGSCWPGRSGCSTTSTSAVSTARIREIEREFAPLAAAHEDAHATGPGAVRPGRRRPRRRGPRPGIDAE